MRALIQRVKQSSVEVKGEEVARVGAGLLILLGVTHSDTEEEAVFLADKVAKLRIFEDEEGKMNRSLIDIRGELLVVSQFTLYADCSKGRRPSFTGAAPPETAEMLYNLFCRYLENMNLKVEKGIFGAKMLVALENDGPVTIILEKT